MLLSRGDRPFSVECVGPKSANTAQALKTQRGHSNHAAPRHAAPHPANGVQGRACERAASSLRVERKNFHKEETSEGDWGM